MTVIYARTNIPKGRRSNRPDIREVTARYVNCGVKCGVVDTKNRPITKKKSDTPDLDLSTNYMKFAPKGETKELGIITKGSWTIR